MNQINKGYLIWITLAATLGGILFGYDTAVISGAVNSLKAYFELSDAQEGFALSSALMGVLALIFVFRFIPETKNKTLEEMENLWQSRIKKNK